MTDRTNRSWIRLAALLVVTTFILVATPALAARSSKKPNILVIFGDDIGMWNISAYSHGMMS